MGREVARTPVGERGRGLAYLGRKGKNVLTVAQKVQIQNLKKKKTQLDRLLVLNWQTM